MKTIFKKWFVGLLAAVATLAGGCSDPDGIVEELDVDRVFSPLNFEVLLENNVNATFSWTVIFISSIKFFSLIMVVDCSGSSSPISQV